MINPLAAALAAVLEQAVQTGLHQLAETHQLDEDTVRDLINRTTAPLADRLAELAERVAELAAHQAAGLGDELLKIKARLDELEATDARDLTKDQVREIAETAAEAAIEQHCSDYDHNEYDGHISDDDKHFEGDIEDAVRDALNNASISISF
jgi:hypothetical protein